MIPGGGVGPTNYAMTDFGWDDTHGQAGTPASTSRMWRPIASPLAWLASQKTRATEPSSICSGPSGRPCRRSPPATPPWVQRWVQPSPRPGSIRRAPANSGLGFSWSQHLENGTNVLPIHVRLAVQTAAGNWYVSNGVFDTGTTGAGSQGNFDPQFLNTNPTKTNWLNLTIGATPADGVTIGAQPAANLTGNITGVGFVAAFNANASTTVHIDFVDVGIPPVPGDVNGDRLVTIGRLRHHQEQFRPQRRGTGTGRHHRRQRTVHRRRGCESARFCPVEEQLRTRVRERRSRWRRSAEPASAVLMVLNLPLGWGMLRLRKKNSARRLG